MRAPARGFSAADGGPDLGCERSDHRASLAGAQALIVLCLVDDELREAGHSERQVTVLVRVDEPPVEEALATDGDGRGAKHLGEC
ncbi:hypothetical protein C5E08_12480 [Rathayibacter iranicus]|uniref:Uncharacterized protein n=1 Tax=Rathayibacter iranicus TaxID=59737 RepID=A0AAD1AE45_9MICO|nr:hypothetical protein C7V51_12645 [Rathayibacter iranicus]PPI43273.1 hypothetical protein C5E09_11570 [Rathayibacter iranicus]PPI58484.1 hypothetical protein C5E08_12480 [Rathayibacter iranicus]PPI69429.1 hypothetical protein C5E01_11530 [Rathayibacter iranicus]